MNIVILNRVGLLLKIQCIESLFPLFFSFNCKSTSRNENKRNVDESFKLTKARI